MLTAVNNGKLTLEQLVEKLYTNPKRIFKLPDQGADTFVEVDMDKKWFIDNESLLSKSGWTPFIGMPMRGAVHRVVIRGEVVFVDGHVIADRGIGKNVAHARGGESVPLKKTRTPQTIAIEPKRSPAQIAAIHRPRRKREITYLPTITYPFFIFDR